MKANNKTEYLTIRIPEPTLDILRDIANEEGRSLSQVGLRLVEFALLEQQRRKNQIAAVARRKKAQ